MSIRNLLDVLIYDYGVKLVLHEVDGQPTIGLGHRLDEQPITTKIALAIARDDIEDVREEMAEHTRLANIMLNIDKIRVVGLVRLAFEIGVGELVQMDEMLSALENKNWIEAYNHGLDTEWARKDMTKAERVMSLILTATFNAYNPEYGNL